MAGIKHKATKASGEKGLATEWNDDHEIDGNVDQDQNQFLNAVIENRTDWPAGPVEGQIVWRSDLNKFYVYDGTSWKLQADNLGNHTATQNLDMNHWDINNIEMCNVSGDLSVTGTGEFHSNVGMFSNRILNLANPINNQDAATKKYVDTTSGQTTFQETSLASGWQNISSSDVVISVSAGQKVLILISCGPYTIQTSIMNVGLARGSTNLHTSGDLSQPSENNHITLQYLDVPGAGTFTYRCRIYSDNPGDDVYDGLITVLVFN